MNETDRLKYLRIISKGSQHIEDRAEEITRGKITVETITALQLIEHAAQKLRGSLPTTDLQAALGSFDAGWED